MSKKLEWTDALDHTLIKLCELRKTRGEGMPSETKRDVHLNLAAAHIMAVEEMDGDDTAANGWGPK